MLTDAADNIDILDIVNDSNTSTHRTTFIIIRKFTETNMIKFNVLGICLKMMC